MVYFHTKNPDSGKFWSASVLKILVYFMATLNMLRQCDIFYCYCIFFGIFSRSGILYPEKSGSPAFKAYILSNNMNYIIESRNRRPRLS
jgi:hypothetical protein